MKQPILQGRDLRKEFRIGREAMLGRAATVLKAVDGVSLELLPGEALGLVGESGSGKSTVARLLADLSRPTSGEVLFHGKPVDDLSRQEYRAFREGVQMVFQDPYSSLNPRMSVLESISEPLVAQRASASKADRQERVGALLKMVGLQPDMMSRYPHEFSGGQRQRIGIARALALSPQVLICDEPVSALDVSIQAQIINLLGELQQTLGLSLLFISHDLEVVRTLCTRVAVMYAGRVVEVAESANIYRETAHPYTRALLNASPKVHFPDWLVKFEVSPRDITGERVAGCAYEPRCQTARSLCQEADPFLARVARGVSEGEHQVACHFPLGQKIDHEPRPSSSFDAPNDR